MVNKDLPIFLAVNFVSDLHMKICCSLQVAPPFFLSHQYLILLEGLNRFVL